MAVPSVNITIEQGADFTATFTIANNDSSVYNLNQRIRSKVEEAS